MKNTLIVFLSIILGNYCINAMNLPEVKNDMVTKGTYSELAKRTKGPNRRAPNRAVGIKATHIAPAEAKEEQVPGMIETIKSFTCNHKKKLLALAAIALATGGGYKLYKSRQDKSYKVINID